MLSGATEDNDLISALTLLAHEDGMKNILLPLVSRTLVIEVPSISKVKLVGKTCVYCTFVSLL